MRRTARSEAFGVDHEDAGLMSGLSTASSKAPATTTLDALLDAYRDAVIRYAQWQPSDRADAMRVAVKVDADTREARAALISFYRKEAGE